VVSRLDDASAAKDTTNGLGQHGRDPLACVRKECDLAATMELGYILYSGRAESQKLQVRPRVWLLPY
jgi:hypothetical protein